MGEPIDRIEWRPVDSLRGNDYNPNVTFNAELDLLERSILTYGWTTAILVNRDGTIIDGFHRARVAASSKALRERYAGKVPCSVIDVAVPEAMILTVAMNRARGTHVAGRMSDLVRRLIDEHGMDPDDLAKRIGGDRAEIDLLYQADLLKHRKIQSHEYSRAWVPEETTRRAG